jgi:hypothetical protein
VVSLIAGQFLDPLKSWSITFSSPVGCGSLDSIHNDRRDTEVHEIMIREMELRELVLQVQGAFRSVMLLRTGLARSDQRHCTEAAPPPRCMWETFFHSNESTSCFGLLGAAAASTQNLIVPSLTPSFSFICSASTVGTVGRELARPPPVGTNNLHSIFSSTVRGSADLHKFPKKACQSRRLGKVQGCQHFHSACLAREAWV